MKNIVILLLFFTISSGANAYNSGPYTSEQIGGAVDTMSESGVGSGVYGDLDGWRRVLALESAIDSITPQSHPRLFLDTTLIQRLVAKEQANTSDWSAVKTRADASTANIQDNSLVAITLANDTVNYPSGWMDITVQSYIDRVISGIASSTATAWPSNQVISTSAYRNVSVWAIGLDWCWHGLTTAEREAIIDKIATYIDYSAAYTHWNNRANETGIRKDMFHREEWAFYSWRQWPEIAIAGHNTTANPGYGDAALAFLKRRWAYDTYWGDALRWLVYQNDGQPMEGYQHGCVGIGWFIPLKTAFGISQWETYMQAAANQSIYELDVKPGDTKMALHYGYSGALGGIYSLSEAATSPFRQRDYMMRGASYFNSDPLQQHFLKNYLQFGTNLGSISWLFSQETYSRWDDFEPIADALWYDTTLSDTNFVTANYATIPTGKVWGKHRAISRTGFGEGSTIFELRARSATTRTSHSLWDAGSFQIYRDGNLSADTGVYDALWGQTITRQYLPTTLATNGILLVDPANPGAPLTQVSSYPNYGGTDGATMRTFGYDYSIGTINSGITGTVAGHSSYIEEANIVASKTTEQWDWFAVDMTNAYKSRATEVTRQAVVVKRSNNDAYVVIFDRVEAPIAYIKKFIQHYHDDPTSVPEVSGTIDNTTTEVPGHILRHESTSPLRLSANNPGGTYKLHTWNLLPESKTLRIVGGRGTEENCNTDGYDMYTEGSTPTNYRMDWWPGNTDCIEGDANEIVTYYKQFANVDADNFGTWRSELSAQSQSSRDYFLTVMKSSDTTSSVPIVSLSGDAEATIIDGTLSIAVNFQKTGDLGGNISVVENGTSIVTSSFSSASPPSSGKRYPIKSIIKQD